MPHPPPALTRPFRTALLAPVLVLVAAAQDRPEIFVQLGHTGRVNAIAVSPDGHRALSGGDDGLAIIWDLDSGKEIRALPQEGSVDTVALSPDGSLGLVGASSRKPMALALYRLDTGDLVRRFPTGGAYFGVGAFLPGGGQLLSMDEGEQPVVWDVATGARVRTFPDPLRDSGAVNRLVVSPDGRYAAASGINYGKPKGGGLWELASGRLLARLPDDCEAAVALAFAPDSKTLLTVGSRSRKGVATLWRVPDGRRLWENTGHEAVGTGTTHAGFTPDGRRVEVTGFRMHYLDAATGKVLEGSDPYGSHVLSRANVFSPDGRRQLIADGREILVFDPASPSVKLRLTGETTTASHLSIEPGTGRVLVQRDDMPMEVWDLAAGTRVAQLANEGNAFPRAEWLAGGSSVVGLSGEQGSLVSLWDTRTGKRTADLPQDHQDRVHVFALSADGRRAASSSSWLGATHPDTAIRIWDLAGRRLLMRLPVADKSWDYLALSPDGQYLMAAMDMDKTLSAPVAMFSVASGQLLWQSRVKTSFPQLSFARDGSWCMVNGMNDTLAILDVHTGKVLRSMDSAWPTVWFGSKVSVSPDSHQVLMASGAGMSLVDAVTFKELRHFQTHGDQPEELAFSPDGRLGFMATFGGVVRVWELATGRELAALITFKDGEWISVTPEGYYAASAKGDTHLNVRQGARVVGIAAYGEALYRPDLVKASLSGQSLSELRTIAQIRPAPLVTLLPMPARTEQEALEVTLRLQDQGGGLGEVRLYLNGTAVRLDQARGIQVTAGPGGAVRAFTVHLVAGSNELRATAGNADNSMQAESGTARVEAVLARVYKPRLQALVVGIQAFRNPNLALRYPAADAQSFAEALQRVAGRLFDQVQVKCLTSPEDTSREALQAAFRGFQGLEPGDTFLFYVASHGVVDDGEYFLLTSNVGSTSTQRLKADALSQADLKELIANVPCTKKLVFLDTCSAGALGNELQKFLLTRGLSEQSAMNLLSRAVGSTILSASTSAQEALEGYEGHGLFTFVLTEGLKGKAARAPGEFIRTTELATYVEDHVSALADQVFHRAQYPTVCISGESFPIGKGD